MENLKSPAGVEGLTKAGQGAIEKIEDFEFNDLDAIGQKWPEMKSGTKSVLYFLLAGSCLINPTQAAWATLQLAVVPVVVGLMSGVMGLVQVGRSFEEEDFERKEHDGTLEDSETGTESDQLKTETVDVKAAVVVEEHSVEAPPTPPATRTPTEPAKEPAASYPDNPWANPSPRRSRDLTGAPKLAANPVPKTLYDAPVVYATPEDKLKSTLPIAPVKLNADVPHLLLWGRTQGGKTTTAAHLLAGAAVNYVTIKSTDKVPTEWDAYVLDPRQATAQVDWLLDKWESQFYARLDGSGEGEPVWFLVDELISVTTLVAGATATRLVDFITQVITAGVGVGAFFGLMTQSSNSTQIGIPADLLLNCSIVGCSGQKRTNQGMAKAFMKYSGYGLSDEQLEFVAGLDGYWQIWDNDGPCLSQITPVVATTKHPARCQQKDVCKKAPEKLSTVDPAPAPPEEEEYGTTERRRTRSGKTRLKLDDNIPSLPRRKTFKDATQQIVHWFEGGMDEIVEKDLLQKFKSDERAAVQPYLRALIKHIVKTDEDFEVENAEDGSLTLYRLEIEGAEMYSIDL